MGGRRREPYLSTSEAESGRRDAVVGYLERIVGTAQKEKKGNYRPVLFIFTVLFTLYTLYNIIVEISIRVQYTFFIYTFVIYCFKQRYVGFIHLSLHQQHFSTMLNNLQKMYATLCYVLTYKYTRKYKYFLINSYNYRCYICEKRSVLICYILINSYPNRSVYFH